MSAIIEPVAQEQEGDEVMTFPEKVRFHVTDARETVAELREALPDLMRNPVWWIFMLLLALEITWLVCGYRYVTVPSWPVNVCDPIYYSPINAGCR